MIGNIFNWKNALTILFGTAEGINAFFPVVPVGISTAIALIIRALFPTANGK
jgi:hypothetical protein